MKKLDADRADFHAKTLVKHHREGRLAQMPTGPTQKLRIERQTQKKAFRLYEIIVRKNRLFRSSRQGVLPPRLAGGRRAYRTRRMIYATGW